MIQVVGAHLISKSVVRGSHSGCFPDNTFGGNRMVVVRLTSKSIVGGWLISGQYVWEEPIGHISQNEPRKNTSKGTAQRIAEEIHSREQAEKIVFFFESHFF